MGAPEPAAPLAQPASTFSYEHEGDRQFATTLARGLEVLRCFTPLEPLLGNKEISVRTGLPKPTVSRLTYTLTKLGYLRHNMRLGKYQLGSAGLSIGYPLLPSVNVRPVARPLNRQVPRGHRGARFLRLDGRAAPRGLGRGRADARHRRRRDRFLQLRRPRLYGEKRPARGRPRPASGRHGAQHRGFARAALKEVLFYFQGLDADAKLAAIHALRILVILALAWVLQAIAARLIRVFRSYMARRTRGDAVSPVETLARVFRSAAAVGSVIGAATLLLNA